MKKFIVVSSVIFLCIASFFITFKMIFGDNVIADDRDYRVTDVNESFEAKFVGWENTEEGTNIIVSIKNSSSNFIKIDKITGDFSRKMNGDFEFNSLYFTAVEKGWYDYYKKRINLESGKDYQDKNGIDPGETMEYLFYLPKGLKFDSEIYDLNNIIISIKGSTYKFKILDNIRVGGFNGFYFSEEVQNTGEPIIIK